MQQHLTAAVFFIALLTFEVAYFWRVRRLAPHPLVPVAVRALLLFVYVGSTGVDLRAGLTQNATLGLGAGLVLSVVAAVVFRPAWRLTTQSLAALAAVAVEELIFRGAFLLPAMTTPTGMILGLVGSTLANVVWRVPSERARGLSWNRVLALSLAFLLAYGTITALTRSLWPALLTHAVIELSRVRRPIARTDVGP